MVSLFLRWEEVWSFLSQAGEAVAVQSMNTGENLLPDFHPREPISPGSSSQAGHISPGPWCATSLHKPSIFYRKRWALLKHLLQTFSSPTYSQSVLQLSRLICRNPAVGVSQDHGMRWRWPQEVIAYAPRALSSPPSPPRTAVRPTCCCQSPSFQKKKRTWREYREGMSTWGHSSPLVVEMKSLGRAKHRITCSYGRYLIESLWTAVF